MAVVLMTGSPGAGKSYSAVALTIVPALEMGRPIVTNMELNETAIKSIWPNAVLLRFDLRDPDCWEMPPGGALVVIDEAHEVWPSGQRQDQLSVAQRQYLAMSRHNAGPVGESGQVLSSEVVLLTQASSNIAKWVRGIVDRTYVITKLDAVGASSRYRCDVYQGYEETMRPRAKSKIRSFLGTYDARWTGLYCSHTKAAVTGPVAEVRGDGVRRWYQAPGLWRLAGGGVVGVAAAVWALSSLLGVAGTGEPPGEPVPVAPLANTRQEAGVPAVSKKDAAKPMGSQKIASSNVAVSRESAPKDPVWRLGGYIFNPETRQYRIVLDDGGGRVRVLAGVPCELVFEEVRCVVDGFTVSPDSGAKKESGGIIGGVIGG